MEDVGDTGLARCWAEGPAVGCAAHAALASTTTRAAAAMAPRMCLSPLSPREPVTNRLRVCCSGARAGIIMPLPGAGVRHAWSLSPGLPQTRRWTVAGSLRNQRSLPPTGGSGQGEPRLHRRGDAAGPLDRTPHAAAPPTTQSTTDEVLGSYLLDQGPDRPILTVGCDTTKPTTTGARGLPWALRRGSAPTGRRTRCRATPPRSPRCWDPWSAASPGRAS